MVIVSAILNFEVDEKMYIPTTPHWHSGAEVLHSVGLRASSILDGVKRFTNSGVDAVFATAICSGHSNVVRVTFTPLTETVDVFTTVADGQEAGPAPPA